MSIHREISFENEICDYLADHGWLYAEGDAANYDRKLALYPPDVLAWVQATQPEVWEAMTKNHGEAAGQKLLERLRDAMDKQSTLSVLRQGFDVLGLRRPVQVAQFKPALGLNPEITAKYQANRLRVIRQVKYSLHNENSIDIVLFLNGIPVATVELKTDFTQSVEDAVDQYRYDRLPQLKGKPPEPLLSFPGGALVHFAVSNSNVKMATKLVGPATFFLPFDQGDNEGSGNSVDGKGHPTRYLWEEVWERESWLDILGRYLVAEKDKKKNLKTIIFPRYHQLDATRELQKAIIDEGPGKKYLIQHSAGSGKTKSIAWTAHFLADLHKTTSDGDSVKVFDSVLVVSDRNVIDGQLQDEIEAFQRTAGVVATIKSKEGSKSAALAEALSGTKKVVVCTIQTFPFALEAVQEMAATQGKKFCVIADEAHSSQTGEAASKLKQVLAAQGEATEPGEDGVVEIDSEEMLAAFMAARAASEGITYIAFTATPKAKTLELFGRRPNPDAPSGEGNLPTAFHVYSMRQAIEEGFILDVLQNYTTYSLAFKLAQQGEDSSGGHSGGGQKEVERSEAMKGLMGWVRLHPYNISQKVEIIVEHYRELVSPLLDGNAKAMVVVGSRLEAVRWQLAMDKYIKNRGYGIRTLVAFSGEVNDSESGPEPFRETSKSLNPGLDGSDIAEAFKDETYQILIVANKFQTGFDQPLLCSMYVDKKLAGIQAVQTLSRLNRCHPGKDTTYVLDFVNDSKDVLEAFKTYYTTAQLADETDPQLVLDLKVKLDATGYYDEPEVERLVKIVMDPNSKQSQLEAAIGPVADRLLKQFSAAKEKHKAATDAKDSKAAQDAKDTMEALWLFRSDLMTYLKAYTFLAQIFDYGNTDFEKRAIFYKYLQRLLKFGREREGVDLSQIVLTHHNLKSHGKQKMNLAGEDIPALQPLSDAGSGKVNEKEKAYLAEIIEKVNDLFTGELSENDKLVYVNNVLKGKLMESETLQKQAVNNSKEQFATSPDLQKELVGAIIEALDAHTSMSTQALNSELIQAGLRDILIGPSRLYEGLRDRAVS
ncbi:MAG: type I restriction endonuclease [Planctomycetota bacterium]